MSEPNTVIAVFVLVPAQLEAGNTKILLGNPLLWRLPVQFCRFMSVTCFRQSSEVQPKAKCFGSVDLRYRGKAVSSVCL